MRVIIAGSRDITDPRTVREAVRRAGFDVTEVVCGMARGVDLLGYDWADAHGIPVKEFPAYWKTQGRGAGSIRNTRIAKYAAENDNGALIVVWDGESRGTLDMVKTANEYGLKLKIFRYCGVTQSGSVAGS